MPSKLKKNNNIKFAWVLAVYCAALCPPLPALAAPENIPSAIADNLGGNTAGSYLAGQFARSNGNIDNAISSLKRVYDDDPGDPAIAAQLLGMLLVEGKVDEAIELAAGMRKNHGKDPLTGLLISLRTIKNNRLGEAADFFDEETAAGTVQLWQPLISAWLDLATHRMNKPLTVETFSGNVGRAAPIVNYHLALINAQAGFIKAASEKFQGRAGGCADAARPHDGDAPAILPAA